MNAIKTARQVAEDLLAAWHETCRSGDLLEPGFLSRAERIIERDRQGQLAGVEPVDGGGR